jgi:prepilin-type N-terminal cleavage/methylation domain-containing protein
MFHFWVRARFMSRLAVELKLKGATMRERANRTRDNGFTLVELLVVISIIALLVATLLPAINEARENARQVQCLSQVRQHSVAMFSYCADQRDTAFPLTSQHSATWMIRLAPYVGWSGVSQVDESTGNTVDGGLGDRADSTNAVDKKISVFRCPNAKMRTEAVFAYNSGYYGINLDLTSSRNRASPTAWPLRRTLQQIKSSPSRLVLSGEGMRYADIEFFSMMKVTVLPTAQRWGHNSVLNELFVDGHAEGLKLGQRTDLLAMDLRLGEAPSSYYQPGWY